MTRGTDREQVAKQSVSSLVSLDAMEELYDAQHRIALRLAYTIVRNRQEAEEVVQEAFLSVWRARATYDSSRGSQRAWVLTTVRNQALDLLRARKRRPASESLDVQQHESPVDVAATAVATADRESVLFALASLPLPQREALELAFFGGRSHTEIASLLNTPIGTVKGRIRLALNHLRLAIASDSLPLAA